MEKYVYVFTAVCLLAGSFVSTGVLADVPSFEESQVTLAQGIQAIFTKPDIDAQVPAVLLLHGFGSQKDEVGDMYKRLAAELGQEGIASLRIDFRGWGESAGEMVESTVQGQIDDAATAYQYLSQLESVDSARITNWLMNGGNPAAFLSISSLFP